jgi:hypothetical protein
METAYELSGLDMDWLAGARGGELSEASWEYLDDIFDHGSVNEWEAEHYPEEFDPKYDADGNVIRRPREFEEDLDEHFDRFRRARCASRAASSDSWGHRHAYDPMGHIPMFEHFAMDEEWWKEDSQYEEM